MSPPVILSAPELLKLLDEPRRVDELTPYLKSLPQQLFEPNLLKHFTQLAIRDQGPSIWHLKAQQLHHSRRSQRTQCSVHLPNPSTKSLTNTPHTTKRLYDWRKLQKS